MFRHSNLFFHKKFPILFAYLSQRIFLEIMETLLGGIFLMTTQFTGFNFLYDL